MSDTAVEHKLAPIVAEALNHMGVEGLERGAVAKFLIGFAGKVMVATQAPAGGRPVDPAQLLRAQKRLEACSTRLLRLQRKLLEAQEAEDAAERVLADRVTELQLAGVEGKNAAEREAALAAATTTERAALEDARRLARRARYAVDRSTITYDTARARVRAWRAVVARGSGADGNDVW